LTGIFGLNNFKSKENTIQKLKYIFNKILQLQKVRMNRLPRCIFLFFLFIAATIASADSSIDNLLANIEEKCDLSLKTKQENGGVIYIFTRHDLDVMQVKHLRDILKSTSIGYKENRYSIVDPMGMGNVPFLSGSIRIFIDNQEVTSALYGSGLVVLGDMDMSFVDHIEIYTQSPTYEFSTESTIMLVKLYSRSVLKDSGTKVALSIGSLRNTQVSAYRAAEIDEDWSYFAYVSLNDDKRENYLSKTTELSRDKKLHIFLLHLSLKIIIL